MEIKYFDNAATTKIKDEVFEEMKEYLTYQYGNPSSLYSIGRKSKKAIEDARKKVAKLINANPNEIIFTSGGSESDNTIIKGIALKNRFNGRHIITSKIEHPAVLNTCKALEKRGFLVTYLNVNEKGIIDIEELKNSIRYDTVLISIMYANNEIGTIQPIKEISQIANMNNIYFHTDAVQACGNLKIDVKEEKIDALSLSGHKIGAPKGIGALFVKKSIDFEKLIYGGHQEKNRRAGTENVASIIGLGKACEIADERLERHMNHLKHLRNYYIKRVENEINDARLNGDRYNRLEGNANFSFKDVNSQTLLLKLDEKGICVSSGSACSSGDDKPSHVLEAIGLDEKTAKEAVRVTFGDDNTINEVDYLVDNLKLIINELRNKN